MATPRSVQHPSGPEAAMSSAHTPSNPAPAQASGPGSDVYLPAPYGKACAECVKTKRKCMLPPTNGECQRCHRLHKTCHRPPATGIRKRATGSRASSRAALEEKLDNLVNLLQQKSGGNNGAIRSVSTDGAAPATVIATTTDVTTTPGSSASALSPGTGGGPGPADGPASVANDVATLVAPSPNRATLQDLAEASASASSTSSSSASRQNLYQDGSDQSVRQQQQQQQSSHSLNHHQHQQPLSYSQQESSYYSKNSTPVVPLSNPSLQPLLQPPVQPPLSHQQHQLPAIYPNPSALDPGHQMTPVAKSPSGTKRAQMPDIFNPAREFITTSIQDDILHNGYKLAMTPSWLPQDLSPADEESILNLFRTENMTYFPFVYIPNDVTAKQVKAERPFLWLAITAVVSKSASVKVRNSALLREVVGHHLMRDNPASLDMLQGLIVFLAWGNHQMSRNIKSFMCIYIHMAMSILTVLTISKPHNEYLLSLQSSPPSSFSDREMDEKRAALGCYYISSSLSYFLHIGSSIQSMSWMPYMDEYLAEISAKQQSPHDNVLVIMIKCQLVTKEATSLLRDTSERNEPKSECTKIMQTMQYKMLQTRMTEVKNSVPPELRDHYAIQSVINTAEMSINDVSCWDISPTEPWINTERIAILSRCFSILKDWFARFQEIPIRLYISLPFNFWFQLFRNCCILCKLTTIDQKGWDRVYVRQSLDVLAVINEISQNFRNAACEAGVVIESEEDDVFSRSIRPLRHMHKAWESYLTQTTGMPGIGALTPTDSAFDGAQSVGSSVVSTGFTSNPPLAGVLASSNFNEGFNLDFGLDFDWFADMYSYGKL
ncbi:hypothetical protein BROUX41_004205 [Berkeleyomyces rouxiae]|uniref:uncharacterized protein n=1 Tax=Berkeleyomyces rouxiae TaxID=2035830 RepID=UPI003B7BF1F3